MRATGLLRAVARSSQHLEAGAPTGLTGLLTHASPRSSLIFTYNHTLAKLKQLPESSVYRQSTEALTKHRLSIIEAVKPEGLSEWQGRVRNTIEAHPQAFESIASQANPSEVNFVRRYVRVRPQEAKEAQAAQEVGQAQNGQGAETLSADMSHFISDAMAEGAAWEAEVEAMEAEPPLTADQINEIEQQIGAGLIEEVIQVAEGESALVDSMIQEKVWEDLEEKPVEGQWTYHERDTHTPTTQSPPS
ncbi:hypothetical protein CAC42_1670 [Sphaceloma murrayae]|uniref:NADH-ubiquinone oxidoreductase 29.9 kDa subunit, mitochondrial n=1 Tax=Sphaceloma murrayae TaxID=2082308 RepID=A0A2K1QHL9_9PEZI|nr:hypothetical protein CAC42_1670 [Sphaceloma murrayae]